MTKEKSPLRQKDIRTGAQQERERIIALLEAHVSDLDLEWFEMKWSDMVALIRGNG
jgi:hypothetical protein